MSTPKRKRCKYPHFVAVRVDDELYEKINNGAIAAGVSPSEYLRQIIKKGHLIVKREAVIEVPLIKKLIAEYGKAEYICLTNTVAIGYITAESSGIIMNNESLDF